MCVVKGNETLPHTKSSPLCGLIENCRVLKELRDLVIQHLIFTDEETEKNILIIPFQKLMGLELNYLNS